MRPMISQARLVALPTLLFVILLGSGCAATDRAPLNTVIEPEALAERLSDPSAGRLVLLDTRDDKAYQAAHVAGATQVDLGTFKKHSLDKDNGLTNTSFWQQKLGAMGVSGTEPVVIYDGGNMTGAARVWFVLQHAGVPEVAVVNGGYPAMQPLIDAGRIPISDTPTAPQPVTFRHASVSSARVGLAERPDVRRSIARHEAQILDTRTPQEYTGRKPLRNPRGGHLPTAINLPHTQFLTEDGRLKSPETLARLFEDAGFQRGEPLIAHCQSGGRASLAALAAQRAGFGPIMNYYASFGDWAADTTCPIETSDTE